MATPIQIALGAFQVGKNLIDGGKAKKEQAALEANKPIRRTSQSDLDSAALAESELAQGMSSAADKSYNDATDRSVATSISAILKSGGDSNSIGEIYDSTEKGRQNLAIMKDQLRLNQIQNVLKSNETLAEEDSTNWLVNEYGPYINKQAAASQSRQNAAQGVMSGLDTLGAGVAGMFAPKLPTDVGGGGNSKVDHSSVNPIEKIIGGSSNLSNILSPSSVPSTAGHESFGSLRTDSIGKIGSGVGSAAGGIGKPMDWGNFWQSFDYNF